MLVKLSPKAVSAAPARQMPAVTSVIHAAPKRSTSTPPTRMSTKLGTL